MKILIKGCLFLIFIIILVPVFILGYFGFIPGLSYLFGSNKPRDLGIKYTKADLTSLRNKTKVVFEELPPNTPIEESREYYGSRPVKEEFSSKEITAAMNNRYWRYWPYKDVHVKFNADGSAEISGMLIKDRVPGYCTKIGIPKEAVNFVMRFLPPNPVFYVKGKASLTNNQVSLFEPQIFEIGRLSLPVEIFLSMTPLRLVKYAYALDVAEMVGELNKVKNKKALIIDYINNRLTKINGFYAKTAYCTNDKLIFEGTLPEKEKTLR